MIEERNKKKINARYAVGELCDLMREEYDIKEVYKDTLYLAREALEKQVPKKPNLEGDGYSDGQLVYDTWYCPNCEKAYELEYEEYDYCPSCGQAIDWNDEETGEGGTE